MRLGPLRRGVVRALGPIGGYRLASTMLRRSPRIFMYHRFTASNEARKLPLPLFEAQLRIIAREFNVVTVGELVREIRRNGRPRPYTAAITVDDGHRDFVDLAVPSLERYGLKATLFVTTEFAEGTLWLWPDRLEYALCATRKPSVDVDALGRLQLDDEAARRHAWQRLVDHCTRIANDERKRLLDGVIAELGVDIPERPVGGYDAVSVDELRDLARKGFEIGAHTQRHPILSRLPASELDDEIAGSKHKLEAWLEQEIPSFCYPNGTPNDYNDTVKERVRAAGFESAVAAHFRSDVLDDLYEIKRYACRADMFQFRRNAYGIEYVSSALRERFGI